MSVSAEWSAPHLSTGNTITAVLPFTIHMGDKLFVPYITKNLDRSYIKIKEKIIITVKNNTV
jgi:hypothetical protein